MRDQELEREETIWHGRFVPLRHRRIDPARRLLAALMLQALLDAWRGDPSAIAWMDEVAPKLALLLDIDPDRLAGWRACRLRCLQGASGLAG